MLVSQRVLCSDLGPDVAEKCLSLVPLVARMIESVKGSLRKALMYVLQKEDL